jgi:hypothetical protein
MCFDNANQDVDTITLEFPGRIQHRIGFPHASGCTEIDAKLTSRSVALLRLYLSQECIGVGALIAIDRHGVS